MSDPDDQAAPAGAASDDTDADGFDLDATDAEDFDDGAPATAPTPARGGSLRARGPGRGLRLRPG